MAAIYPPDHADGCACDACMPYAFTPETDTPQLIFVGLPHLSGPHNGHAKAEVFEGEVWVTLHGMGSAELSMPKAEATALRDQLNNAINSL